MDPRGDERANHTHQTTLQHKKRSRNERNRELVAKRSEVDMTASKIDQEPFTNPWLRSRKVSTLKQGTHSSGQESLPTLGNPVGRDTNSLLDELGTHDAEESCACLIGHRLGQ